MPATIVTLIAAPEAAASLAAAAAAAARALEQLGAPSASLDWLAESIACDIALDGIAPDQADAACRHAITQALGTAPIDVVAQPSAGRRKMLLVADMEATVIANEMLDELAALRGIEAQISAITARAMNGELDFAAAVTERVALLKGLPESALATVAARMRINPGARPLVATMRAAGARTALVSGGFRVFAEEVGRRLGFDRIVANDLVLADGKLAGTVKLPILAREAKLQTLTALAAERGLSLAATLAVGDGANDLPMIEAAGLGIAYHAKPNTVARARWRIDHADLSALLYAQGYRRDEIVAG